MQATFDDNKNLIAVTFNIYDHGFSTVHNSHTRLTLHEGHGVNLPDLYAKLRAIDGVSDVEGSNAGLFVEIGVRNPTDPVLVVKDVLGLLQQERLLTVEQVREAYHELGFSKEATNLVSTEERAR